METMMMYANPWQVKEQDFPEAGSAEEQLSFLLNYAILAPSTRNSQPWKFAVSGEAVHLFADISRWQQVADSHRRELHISVGCALENLLIAAAHFGLTLQVIYFPDGPRPEHVATARLSQKGQTRPFQSSELFHMIPERFTNHQAYNGEPIPHGVLDRLQECCVKSGVHLHLTRDVETKRQVDELVTRADATLFANPAYREEVAHCIGQGNFGSPWLLSVIGQLATSYLNRGKSMARKDHELLMSSPVLGLLSTHKDDKKEWVQVGQVLERLYLLTASHGVCLQPVSQLIVLPDIRAELAKLLPTEGLFPQQPFRIGYSEAHSHHTPRRSLQDMLVAA